MNYNEFKQGWRGGLPETPCGSGSKLSNTVAQREWIPEMVEKYKIKSIADIGAGDLGWVSTIDIGCVYNAYDLVPRADEVKLFDLRHDKLPKADCLMVLWVLNHFTADEAHAAAAKIMSSKSRYLITTYREDYYGSFDATVLESIKICNGAEMRLIKL